ncbi:hypothetical protein JCM5350_004412 [Sporobolomyces pararoseus]
MTKQRTVEIDFSHGPAGMYQGKDANNVYQGYRGQLLNPHSTSEERIHAHHMMAEFENVMKSHAQGLRGTLYNPSVSEEVRLLAAEKLERLPHWGE